MKTPDCLRTISRSLPLFHGGFGTLIVLALTVTSHSQSLNSPMKTQSEMHTIGGALTTIICKRETTKLSIQVSIKVGYNDHVNSHEVEVTAFDAQGKSLRITSGEPDGNWSVISTGGAGWAFRIYKISLKDASRLDSIEISRGKAKQRFTANLPPLE